MSKRSNARDMRPFGRNANGRLCHMGQELPGGPWHAEPDRVELKHGELPCLLLRGPGGAWCGYVGLPADHPWIGIDLFAREGPWNRPDALEVTYQSIRPPSHDPPPKTVASAQWIGFSCAHQGGLALDRLTLEASSPEDVYRELAFAERAVRRLAELALAALPN